MPEYTAAPETRRQRSDRERFEREHGREETGAELEARALGYASKNKRKSRTGRDTPQYQQQNALDSQFFGGRKAPKQYAPPASIPDPVRPVPVWGSIGGTGVDMGPFLSDASQRRSLAVSNAAHKLAVAEYMQEGERYEEATAERKRLERVAALKSDIEMRLADRRVAVEEQTADTAQQHADLRAGELAEAQADTPEQRLAEAEALRRQNNEIDAEYDAKERERIKTEETAKQQSRAVVNNAVREAMVAAGDGGDIQTITAAALNAIPGAVDDPVIQNDVARAVEYAMERQAQRSKTIEAERKAEEAEIETLAEQLIAQDESGDEPVIPRQGNPAGFDTGSDKTVFDALVSVVLSASPSDADIAFVTSALRDASLYEIKYAAGRNASRIEEQFGKNGYFPYNINRLLADKEKLEKSALGQAEMAALAGIKQELADLEASMVATREVRNAYAQLLHDAETRRTNMLIGVARNQAKKNGQDRAEKYEQEAAYDRTTGLDDAAPEE